MNLYYFLILLTGVVNVLWATSLILVIRINDFFIFIFIFYICINTYTEAYLGFQKEEDDRCKVVNGVHGRAFGKGLGRSLQKGGLRAKLPAGSKGSSLSRVRPRKFKKIR